MLPRLTLQCKNQSVLFSEKMTTGKLCLGSILLLLYMDGCTRMIPGPHSSGAGKTGYTFLQNISVLRLDAIIVNLKQGT